MKDTRPLYIQYVLGFALAFFLVHFVGRDILWAHQTYDAVHWLMAALTSLFVGAVFAGILFLVKRSPSQ